MPGGNDGESGSATAVAVPAAWATWAEWATLATWGGRAEWATCADWATWVVAEPSSSGTFGRLRASGWPGAGEGGKARIARKDDERAGVRNAGRAACFPSTPRPLPTAALPGTEIAVSCSGLTLTIPEPNLLDSTPAVLENDSPLSIPLLVSAPTQARACDPETAFAMAPMAAVLVTGALGAVPDIPPSATSAGIFSTGRGQPCCGMAPAVPPGATPAHGSTTCWGPLPGLGERLDTRWRCPSACGARRPQGSEPLTAQGGHAMPAGRQWGVTVRCAARNGTGGRRADPCCTRPHDDPGRVGGFVAGASEPSASSLGVILVLVVPLPGARPGAVGASGSSISSSLHSLSISSPAS